MKYLFKGVDILLPDKSTVDCHVLLLCSTCDLPARALIMNMIQFNGFFGCCHCLQKGIQFYLKCSYNRWITVDVCMYHAYHTVFTYFY